MASVEQNTISEQQQQEHRESMHLRSLSPSPKSVPKSVFPLQGSAESDPDRLAAASASMQGAEGQGLSSQDAVLTMRSESMSPTSPADEHMSQPLVTSMSALGMQDNGQGARGSQDRDESPISAVMSDDTDEDRYESWDYLKFSRSIKRCQAKRREHSERELQS